MRQRAREERASQQRDGEPGGHHGTPGPVILAGGTVAAAGQGPGWTDQDGGTSGQGGHAPCAAAPQAPETGRLYARDWAAFEAWCGAQEQPTLPASPETAAAYLGLLAHPLALSRDPQVMAPKQAQLHGATFA